jgi:hypothetical protein
MEGEFYEDEIVAMYRSLQPASAEAADAIHRTPFSMLSYWVRYPEATTVNVPIGLWKFRRSDKAHEGEWPDDDAGIQALLSEYDLPMSLKGFHIDSAARFANEAGQSEVEVVYTAGTDRGQELRLIVQRVGQGRIEIPSEPEDHPCKRSSAVIGGSEAQLAWLDERYGPFDLVWRDEPSGLEFKLLSSTGIEMGKNWFLGVAEQLVSQLR